MPQNLAEKKDESLTPIQFDIHEMDIDENGVKDFFWPLKQSEHRSFGDDLMASYACVVKDFNEDHTPDIIPYKAMAKFFVCEAIALFQGDVLRERCYQAGRHPVVPSSWRLWPYLMQKQSPNDPACLQQFLQGPSKANYTKRLFSLKFLKKLVRLFRLRGGNLSVDGLKIKAITSDILASSIVSTERTEIIIKHAQEVDTEVIFCRSNRWFDQIKEQELKRSLLQNDKSLEQKLLKTVSTLYEQYGITLQSHARSHLERLLSEGAAALRIHYQRLLEKPEKLPRHLWTGSGGNIWDLLLRLAVMHHGGKVQGHDHAMGQGVYALPLTPFIEFWASDTFVTFNDAQRDGMLANSSTPLVALDNKVPKIVPLKLQKKNATSIKQVTNSKEEKSSQKTVAIMSTVFDCDRGRPEPVPSNIVAIDWQARLIANLKNFGYDVILKIHPESPILPPAKFETELGARIVSDRFEEVIEEIDLVLFDYIYTTTFRTSLETNIPIAITDFYDIQWSDKVQDLIEKRCSIIKGSYDESNRVQFDWDHLKTGLETAPSKVNAHDFAGLFLP